MLPETDRRIVHKSYVAIIYNRDANADLQQSEQQERCGGPHNPSGTNIKIP
jgi:hypothetical protein